MHPEAQNEAARVLALLEEMTGQQQQKLLRAASMVLPAASQDDLLNPDDFPALHHDPRFNYEDGVLSGLRMASAAVRAHLEEVRGADGGQG